jgi:hypothetical protein
MAGCLFVGLGDPDDVAILEDFDVADEIDHGFEQGFR